MAEGIKISEMEQVATLEDGCCFPVVSNGVNKKITQKNLHKLMIQKTLERTQLPSGTDLNNINTPGEYYAIDNVQYANAPCMNFTMQVIVLMRENYLIQVLYEYQSGNMYIRGNYFNGSSMVWSSWNKQVNKSELNSAINNLNNALNTHTHDSLKRTQLPSGTDLNNINTPGEYYAIDNVQYANAPCINFTMQVITLMSGYTYQIIYVYQSGGIFTRTTYYSGSETTWSSWNEVTMTGSQMVLPIYSKDATNQPTAAGAIWIQEVEVTE